MNEKASTQDLDDSDIADEYPDAITISSDDEPKPPPPSQKKGIWVKPEPGLQGPIVRRTPADHLNTSSARPRTSRTGPLDLLSSITCSLDPNLHAACDDERSAQSIQTMHLLSLSNQLRDAQATINDLRTQLSHSKRECSDAERRADRAEMQLDMEKRMSNTLQGRKDRRVWMETLY